MAKRNALVDVAPTIKGQRLAAIVKIVCIITIVVAMQKCGASSCIVSGGTNRVATASAAPQVLSSFEFRSRVFESAELGKPLRIAKVGLVVVFH